jgi:hypothetical protein
MKTKSSHLVRKTRFWANLLSVLILVVLLGGTITPVRAAGVTPLMISPGPDLVWPTDGEILNYNIPTFLWLDYPGATGYSIQVSPYSNFRSPIVNKRITTPLAEFTPATPLPTNRLLYWHVRAWLGGIVYTEWSATWTFYSANSPSTPKPVIPFNNALVNDLSPFLDWLPPATIPAGTAFSYYHVQITSDNTFFFVDWEDVVYGLNNHGYTIPFDLNPNTKYYWRILAMNTNGDYSPWSPVRYFRVTMNPPFLFYPVTGDVTPDLRPYFDWDDVTGATGYTLQASQYSNFTSTILNVTIKTATSEYLSGINFPSGDMFYWRVRANGPLGSSQWSIVETFWTP